MIEGDAGTITFAEIVIGENNSTTLENVNNSMLTGGCQFFIYNNTVYGIWHNSN